MKRFSLLTLLLLLCVQFFSCAGSRMREPIPAYLQEYPCGERHMLWKAAKNAQPDIWLFGSIHVADSSFYPFAPVVDSALDASTLVAAELDIHEDSTLAVTERLVREKGTLPENVLLRDVLPDTLFRRIDSLASSWGFPVRLLESFRPWLVAFSLSAMAFERMGFSGEFGIDREILLRAEDQGKEVFALETPDAQVGIFSNTADSLGIEYLENTLWEIQTADSMLAGVARAWKCGDSRGLRKFLDADTSDDAYEEELGVKRNIRMAKSVDSLAVSGKKVFVVVGSAHLVGSSNILTLLEEKGYRIEAF